MRLSGIRQDVTVRHARAAAQPGFTAAALVTLALGIGATSAIFSVVRAVLLAPLPYAEPDRRVLIWSRWISFDKTWLSDQEILDYRRLSRTMTAVAGWTTAQQNLTGDGEPVRVGVGLVTANTFDGARRHAAAGPGDHRRDEDRPNGPPVAVLGYGLWQARYGGDPAIVGRRILLNDVPVEVVGVMPQGFRLPTDFTEDAAEPTELWRRAADRRGRRRARHRTATTAPRCWRPGRRRRPPPAELQSLTAAMTEQGLYPAGDALLGLRHRPRRRDPRRHPAGAVAADGRRRRACCSSPAPTSPTCCWSAATRGCARWRCGSAVGASTDRLVRQLLTESVVLAVAAPGSAWRWRPLGLRDARRPRPDQPAAAHAGRASTGPWSAFTLVVAVITTLLFGLVPALRTLRVNLVESLREGVAAGHRRRPPASACAARWWSPRWRWPSSWSSAPA